MATAVIRTDRPRLVDSDGYKIPRLVVIVGPNLTAEDKKFNKAERERFEDRYRRFQNADKCSKIAMLGRACASVATEATRM